MQDAWLRRGLSCHHPIILFIGVFLNSLGMPCPVCLCVHVIYNMYAYTHQHNHFFCWNVGTSKEYYYQRPGAQEIARHRFRCKSQRNREKKRLQQEMGVKLDDMKVAHQENLREQGAAFLFKTGSCNVRALVENHMRKIPLVRKFPRACDTLCVCTWVVCNTCFQCKTLPQE